MRSVVVTGISRGLGAALFDQLAGRGDRVLGLGRRFTPAQRALAAAEPHRIRLTHVDLAAAGAGRLLLPRDLCAGVFAGATDVVVLHNAAVVEPVGAVAAVPAADLASAVAVNLTAPMLLTSQLLAARPAGVPTTVLFVSSGAATRAIRGWSAYCATKAGAEMFFAVVAAEYPDVRVHSVNPGRMDTAMQETLRGADFPDAADYIDAHERGALPDPVDVAARIVAGHLTDR